MSDDVAARAVDILDRGDDLATLVREHFGRPTLEPTLRALLQLAFVYDRRGDKTTSCAIIDANAPRPAWSSIARHASAVVGLVMES